MNEDKSYITFSSWWDELIVTGILPFLALVGFNSRIYLKLRASDKQEYRFVGVRQNVTADIPTMTLTTACVQSSDEDDISNSCVPPMYDTLSEHRHSSPCIQARKCSGRLSISNNAQYLIPPNEKNHRRRSNEKISFTIIQDRMRSKSRSQELYPGIPKMHKESVELLGSRTIDTGTRQIFLDFRRSVKITYNFSN